MKVIHGSCATCGFATARMTYTNTNIPETLTLLCMRAGGDEMVHGGATWTIDKATKHAVDASEHASLCVHPDFCCSEFATRDSVLLIQVEQSPRHQ